MTKILIDRSTVEQALEALTPFVRGNWTPGLAVQAAAAMDRLKAALAEPVEPVKQCMAHGECFGGECIYQRPAEPVQEPVLQALADADRIMGHDDESADYVDVSDAEMVDFARAVERAHGIGGEG